MGDGLVLFYPHEVFFFWQVKVCTERVSSEGPTRPTRPTTEPCSPSLESWLVSWYSDTMWYRWVGYTAHDSSEALPKDPKGELRLY